MSRSIGPMPVLATAALLGVAYGLWPLASSTRQAAAVEPIGECRVTDGDTIRCGNERIRLLGIDAPEMPGHCRDGRDCAPGDPYASTASLKAAMSEPLSIERVDEDRYGRTLALVSGASGDLSCQQLRRGHARYVARWDNGGRLASRCPAAR